jgi:para-nitrobenzyl esterase
MPFLTNVKWSQIETHLRSCVSQVKSRREKTGRSLARIALAALWALCPLIASAAAPTVRIDTGSLVGVTESGVLVFKGVPFAAPPLGERRWKPPAQPARWRNPRDASKYAPMCPQVGPAVPGSPAEPTSEDCLYLNVWTSGTQGPLRPIVVFLYGGGFTNGSASTPVYWGHEYAHKGVVVINVQYRLGALGFLAHPELTRESPHHTSGNYGVLDVIAALRWVKRNARAFGGDPNSVTVMGHSAGSYLSGYLLTAPQAKGLIHRVIGMSGMWMAPVSGGGGIPTLAQAEADGQRYAQQLGAHNLQMLRHVPTESILALTTPARHMPIVDGYVMPQDVWQTFKSRRQHDVPVLIGYTSNEGGYLVDPVLSAKDYIARVQKASPLLADRLLNAYPATNDLEADRSQFAEFRDHEFGVHMRAWARMQNRTGRQPVYFYLFDRSLPFPAEWGMGKHGAAHGYELGYVFEKLRPKDRISWTDADYRLQSTINKYWINFIKTGNPNSEGLPDWPRFTPDNERVMRLNEEPALMELPNPAGLDVQEQLFHFTTTR